MYQKKRTPVIRLNASEVINLEVTIDELETLLQNTRNPHLANRITPTIEYLRSLLSKAIKPPRTYESISKPDPLKEPF